VSKNPIGTVDIQSSDVGYKARLESYRKANPQDPHRALSDADEVRKLLAYIEGEGSPKTKECREYRGWILDRLRFIVDGDGYRP
jgi:hypothetical protein